LRESWIRAVDDIEKVQRIEIRHPRYRYVGVLFSFKHLLEFGQDKTSEFQEPRLFDEFKEAWTKEIACQSVKFCVLDLGKEFPDFQNTKSRRPEFFEKIRLTTREKKRKPFGGTFPKRLRKTRSTQARLARVVMFYYATSPRVGRGSSKPGNCRFLSVTSNFGGTRMAKLMCVILDPFLPLEHEEQAGFLLKRVDESYLGKTFKDLIQRVLDPEADEYNPAYDPDDRNIAAQVQGWLDEMNANPSAPVVGLAAITNDDPPQALEVGLNEIVLDYTDRIVRTREQEDVNGQTIAYDVVELYVSRSEAAAASTVETTITTKDGTTAKTKRTDQQSLAELLLAKHVVTGVIAILVIGTICWIVIYQTMAGKEVILPDYLTEIASLVVGYYFGSRTTGPNKRVEPTS